MSQLVVIGPNLIDQSQGTFHVHAFGCADTHKSQYRFHQDDANRPYNYASQQEVIEDVYADIIAERRDAGDTDPANGLDDEFKFFPCVKF